jgi:hypothetical protein
MFSFDKPLVDPPHPIKDEKTRDAADPFAASEVTREKKNVYFELNGTSVDARDFGSENPGGIGDSAAGMLRANELVQADDLSSEIRGDSGSERSPEKMKIEETDALGSFYDRLDTAMSSLESSDSLVDSETARAALEGLGIIDFKKPILNSEGETALTMQEEGFPEGEQGSNFFHSVAARLSEIGKMVENAVGLKLTDLSVEQKKAYGAAALTAFAALPMNEAEAGWLDFGKGKDDNVLVKEAGRGVEKGTRRASRETGDAIGGVIQDVGGAIRRGVGLETPQEKRARERDEQMRERQLQRQNENEVRQFKQEQDKRVREDTRKVADFERATNQHKKTLEDIRKTFNQEFDRAQDTYVRQKDQAKTPEQVSRFEREQWQKWLSSARNAIQKLDDAETKHATGNVSDVIESLKQRVVEVQLQQEALSQSGLEMRKALSELATAMEGKLGVSESGAQNPLRKLSEKSESSASNSPGSPSTNPTPGVSSADNLGAGSGVDYSLLGK